MSDLAERIGKAKAEGRAALIAYLPVGYPTVDASIAAIVAAVEGGADVIEIGVPYSDPGMDGPVIQQAVDVAVRAGVGMRDVLRAVEAVAAAGAVPVVMSYWNPIERYGVDRFASDLAAAGGAGAITPDLIPDEGADWIPAAEKADLDDVGTGLDRGHHRGNGGVDVRIADRDVRDQRRPPLGLCSADAFGQLAHSSSPASGPDTASPEVTAPSVGF